MSTTNAPTNDGRPATLKTRLITYEFRDDKTTGAQDPEYTKLVTKLRETPGRGSFMHCMESTYRTPLESMDVELDTKHAFSNQWNTTNGLRVFDWYEPIYENRRIHQGYYLEITPEIVDFRETLHDCGYCGANYYGKDHAGKFCQKCLGSEYLNDSEFHLLRLMPLSMGFAPTREGPTPQEREELLAIYLVQQTRASAERDADNKARVRKRIEDELQKAKDGIKQAQERYDGFMWLLDHDVNTENCIYYKHTGVFEFGWRGDGVSESVKSALLDILVEFPYQYEIKTTDGKKIGTSGQR